MEAKGKKRRSWDQINFEKFDEQARQFKQQINKEI